MAKGLSRGNKNYNTRGYVVQRGYEPSIDKYYQNEEAMEFFKKFPNASNKIPEKYAHLYMHNSN